MNGLSIYQIKAGRNYNTAAFEADLRTVMKRAGIHEERITFIFSESNALGPAFIERMNALLANGEVPGLFEGDELTQLISEIKQTSPDIGQEGNDLFAEFTRKVQKNLHIIFIMNPANPEFSTCQASSPALFNRCVIDWFGNWSNSAFFQVAYNLIRHVSFPETKEAVTAESSNPYEVVAKTTVDIHTSVTSLNVLLKKIGKKSISMTPRDFLDFIQHFTKLIKEKEDERTDNVRHLSVGLAKLKDTELKVEELQESLAVKDVELQKINVQAEEKMQLIVKQQAVAEDRKREAETLAADLDNKASLMNKRRLEVGDELKLVEPLLREAESAVSNIPKRNLDELRAMANPPQMVKFAVEAVVVMLNNLGNNPTSWEECRKAIKSSDFITRVVTFDSMDTSPVTVQRVKQKYLDTDNWDVDKIMRASKVQNYVYAHKKKKNNNFFRQPVP
jgi:dynein heavy chain 1, cytosolic